MTTYIDGKAVGVGTIRAEIGVSGVVLHDNTLKGNGNTEPLGVDTEVIATKEDLQNIGAESCVKKSGDTMTGDLVFDGHGASETGPEIKFVGLGPNPSYGKEYMTTISTFRGAGFNIETYVDGKSQDVLGFSDGFWGYSHINDKMLNSGAGLYPWKATYTKVLNAGNKVVGDVTSESGGDLIVPTEGGTLARIEDIQNATTILNAGVAGNAQAIQKTREDYIQADSEIHQILNNHAGELTTLRGNQASLGDQVSNIESKIPQSASGSNPLITKQQLLDEEMDIRDDYNELVSELQTQITAQAGAIASIQDEIGNVSLMLDSINGEIV